MLRRWLPVFFALSAAGAQTPPALPPVYTSIVITAKPEEPSIDLRNRAIFEQTLFSRDDQVFQQLNAGINAGQHEGGGKSIEVRRFGFNLDHGGVNGGLKVLVDNVQQNQSTQGHGQGYLGSLKSLTPELIEEVQLINGPFSAEYGDFSSLGVVHIRTREELPSEFTARIQGGNFNSQRGFLAWSPNWKHTPAFLAYEGSHTDGPFLKPLDYRRDNLTGNLTRRLDARRSAGFRFNGGLNTYNSSGQIPLALVTAGALDRFGYLDPGEGGRIRAGTVAAYYRHERASGAVWKADAFLTRSLFDLFSNFTFYLNDPIHGDAIQQHDSRLIEGVNTQYLHPHRFGAALATFTAGADLSANQIAVGLYSRAGRTPLDTLTNAHASLLNAAGYLQESVSLFGTRLILSGGLRYDLFRYAVTDRLDPAESATRAQSRPQPKASLAYSPFRRLPVTLYANYGRGIASVDARSILRSFATGGPRPPIVSTTDFYETGASLRLRRASLSADAFWIDRSNEIVYIADDGTLEFAGPSRSYGYEGKLSVELTRHLSLSAGLTKVGNSFYRGTSPRVYVDRAPHLAANAGLTLSNWRGWTASLRLRAINHYRLDGAGDPALLAAGHTVTDFSMVRRLTRAVDFNFAIDNLANRRYYETQNFLESRPFPNGPALESIHATPGYPRTFTVGLSFRLRGK